MSMVYLTSCKRRKGSKISLFKGNEPRFLWDFRRALFNLPIW